MRWRRGALGVSAAVALLVSGCGEGSGRTTTVIQTTVEESPPTETTETAAPAETGSEPLTADDFRFEADSLCAANNLKQDALEAQGNAGYSFNFDKRSDAILGATVEKLEALAPPPEMAADYEVFLSALHDRLEGTVLGRKEADERRKAAAKELGFRECG